MLHRALVIVVRGAHKRAPEPGQHEDRAPAAGGNDRARPHVEQIARQREVRAATRPDARHLLLVVELVRAQTVGPHAGGVHHVVGAQLELAAADHVAHEHARRAAVPLHQAGHVARVCDHRAEALRLGEDGEHEPGVVGLAVVEEVSGRRLATRERRQHLQHLVAVDGAVALGAPLLALVAPAPPRHHVVHVESHAQHPVGALAAERGDHERQRLHEVRGELHEQRALEQRLAHQPEVEVLEVAKAAMDQLRRAARGAGGEVRLLHERHAVAARRGVQGDPRAGDAAAHHDEVEVVPLE